MKKEKVFLYHADCPDGFGAAYVAWKKFKNKAKYIPVRHGEKLPEDLAGKEVYTLDFAYTGENLEYLLKNTDLTVIDHHVSTRAEVERAPRFSYAVKNSGCVLAWKYFFPDKEMPKLLEYIEDKDLWSLKFKETDAIRERLDMEKMDFKVWDSFMRKIQNKNSKKAILKEGWLLVGYRNDMLDKLTKKAYEVEFEGFKCLALNSLIFESDLGSKFVKMGYPIAIIWRNLGNKIGVSLRSDGKTDVSVIASKYGGGGHKAASGFAIKLGEEFPWKNLNDQK